MGLSPKEMERRAMKRKASFIKSRRNKRRRLQYSDGTKWKPTWPSTIYTLLILGSQGFYMKEAVGLYHNIKDHFPIIDKLVCAKVDFHQETPEYHPIYETWSKFRSFGDLRAFGDISEPSFLLVHRDVYNPRYDPCMTRPPLIVIDDNQRKFELEVLLLGKKVQPHMFMLFKLSDNKWILHDNTPGIPFKPYRIEDLYRKISTECCICSAIYVNTTLAEDYKHGIPETGLCVGSERFCLSRHQQVLSDPKNQYSLQDLETLLQNLSISSS